MSAVLHVEVVQKKESRASEERVKELVHEHLAAFASLAPGALLVGELRDAEELARHVASVRVCGDERGGEAAPAERRLEYHVFRLDPRGPESEAAADGGGGALLWGLPARELEGLWESLVYDCGLKDELLRLAETAVDFGARGVDPLLVGCNRLLLLHGPPGAGKTALCRALAHKLAARLAPRFPRARLLELDAHGLFSKWFAESGKLVARLFERVAELAADRDTLLCVLVDEVESLAHARRAALAGLEPSDAIRAVNAVLTQLDRLRRLPNALMLATSNVPGAVDAAFLDRADVKRFVGPPSARAAYEILRGCCDELVARGAVAPGERLPAEADGAAGEAAARLRTVARDAAAARLSGRALRRLPFLACAQLGRERAALPRFVEALQASLRQQLLDAERLAADGEPAPE